MNMNDVTVGIKLKQDRRGFEPTKTRDALADHCVPPEARAPSSPAVEPVGAGQAKSTQVKAGQP